MKKIFQILPVFITIFIFVSQLVAKPKIWVEQPRSMWSGVGETFVSAKGPIIQAGTFRTADITSLVSDDAQALELAQKSDRYDTYGKWWFWSGFGLGLGGMIASGFLLDYSHHSVTGESSKTPSPESQRQFFTVFFSSFAVYFIGILVGTNYFSDSRYFLYKAMNQYNGVYSTPDTSSSRLVEPLQVAKLMFEEADNFVLFSWQKNF